MRLDEFRLAIRARKEELGVSDAEIEAARNQGGRRTVDKVALLRSIAARCDAEGLPPLVANI